VGSKPATGLLSFADQYGEDRLATQVNDMAARLPYQHAAMIAGNAADYFPLSCKTENSVRARIILYASRDLPGCGKLKSGCATIYEQ
jgi:hypothetical protein